MIASISSSNSYVTVMKKQQSSIRQPAVFILILSLTLPVISASPSKTNERIRDVNASPAASGDSSADGKFRDKSHLVRLRSKEATTMMMLPAIPDAKMEFVGGIIH